MPPRATKRKVASPSAVVAPKTSPKKNSFVKRHKKKIVAATAVLAALQFLGYRNRQKLRSDPEYFKMRKSHAYKYYPKESANKIAKSLNKIRDSKPWFGLKLFQKKTT